MFSQTLLLLSLCGMLADCPNTENSDEHPVEPAKLAALIAQADRIVVLSSNPLVREMVFASPAAPKLLYSSTDPKDIAEFNDAVAVVPPTNGFHCMCYGTLYIQLYRGDTELVAVSNHHGRSIRCALWTSDAMLKDREKWLRWFDARKMPAPRKEVDEMAARAKKRKASRDRWLAAIPKSVRPFWGTVNVIEPNVEPLEIALAEELPDIRKRALVLFAWYGSGDGPWNGYPAYESTAESLLLRIPLSDLIAAAESEELTEAELEGAARLFSGPKFAKLLREDAKQLPIAIKMKLLAHSLKSTDAENISRARGAFAP